MIFGLSVEAYTLLHVLISLAGIASGFVVLWGMLNGRGQGGLHAFFLTTTIATSVTGYGFPVTKLLPSHVVGAISLAVLALAVYARYVATLGGGWRRTYAISAIAAQYLNVFVLVVQSFLKVPALHALAPTQAEPPFAMAQGAVLVAFLVVGTRAVKRFSRPGAA